MMKRGEVESRAQQFRGATRVRVSVSSIYFVLLCFRHTLTSISFLFLLCRTYMGPAIVCCTSFRIEVRISILMSFGTPYIDVCAALSANPNYNNNLKKVYCNSLGRQGWDSLRDEPNLTARTGGLGRTNPGKRAHCV
jgi:hypothetical protein